MEQNKNWMEKIVVENKPSILILAIPENEE
jgi:hypothetical protein